MPSSGGPSEFTRVLGRVSPPPPAQLPTPGASLSGTPPFGASVPGAPMPQVSPAAAPQPQKKSYLPLIIALNVVVLVAVVVVLVFVLGKH
jgi:hypothetical protein